MLSCADLIPPNMFYFPVNMLIYFCRQLHIFLDQIWPADLSTKFLNLAWVGRVPLSEGWVAVPSQLLLETALKTARKQHLKQKTAILGGLKGPGHHFSETGIESNHV